VVSRSIVALLAAPTIGHADPPTSRSYAIELYDGVALGQAATIAMGGAAVANAQGSAGTLVNPSAGAVRPTTDTDSWNWDYHLDAISSTLSSDHDNDGVSAPDNNGGRQAVTFGAAIRKGDWAGALTYSIEQVPVQQVVSGGVEVSPRLELSTQRTIFALSRYLPSIDVALGGALELASFHVDNCPGLDANPSDGVPPTPSVDCPESFGLTAAGVSIGATWLPSLMDFRLGASFRSSFRGGDVTSNVCDPNDCEGYVLPNTVVSPWRVAVGGAYRFAPTAWNQLVGGYWRDERALEIVADVVVTGASDNAFGLESFGRKDLLRSGRHIAISPRVGAEYEWLPGRLRLRLGSYWEPERFVDVGGRLHATFGIEARVFQFKFFGPRRGRITLTGDVAQRYANVGFSVGFWH